MALDIEELKLQVQEAALQPLDADFFRRVSANSRDGSYLRLEEVRKAAVELSPDQLSLGEEGVGAIARVFCNALSELGELRRDREWSMRIEERIGESVNHEWEHFVAIPQRLRGVSRVHFIFYETYSPSDGFVLHCCGVVSAEGATRAVAAWVQTAPKKLSEDDVLWARQNVFLTGNGKLKDLIEERIASRGRR